MAWHISAVASCNLTLLLDSLTFFSIIVLRTFWRTSASFVLFTVTWKNKFCKKSGINSWTFFSIIFHNLRYGLSRQEYIDELKSLYGDEAASYSTVKNWFNKFNRGRCSLKDEVREVCPKTAVVPENIDAVHELIRALLDIFLA